MKELKELGFEFMPTRTEFDKALIKVDRLFYVRWQISSDYRNIVDQPFKLGDFIPCVNGVPVDMPSHYEIWIENKYDNTITKQMLADCENYQQAFEKVKFEGWEVSDRNQYSTRITQNDNAILNVLTDGTFYGVSMKKRYDTIEQAINDGVKLKIK